MGCVIPDQGRRVVLRYPPVLSHWVMNHFRVEWNTVPVSSG